MKSGTVYELTVTSAAGEKRRVLAELKPMREQATACLMWDDTRAAGWKGEFGWVPLLPEEQFRISVEEMSNAGAVKREDLGGDAMLALHERPSPSSTTQTEVERLREALDWICAEPEDPIKVQLWARAALEGRPFERSP